MCRMIVCFGLLLSFLTPASSNNTRGAGTMLRVTTEQGESLDLYENSYALLIGVSRYSER